MLTSYIKQKSTIWCHRLAAVRAKPSSRCAVKIAESLLLIEFTKPDSVMVIISSASGVIRLSAPLTDLRACKTVDELLAHCTVESTNELECDVEASFSEAVRLIQGLKREGFLALDDVALHMEMIDIYRNSLAIDALYIHFLLDNLVDVANDFRVMRLDSLDHEIITIFLPSIRHQLTKLITP